MIPLFWKQFVSKNMLLLQLVVVVAVISKLVDAYRLPTSNIHRRMALLARPSIGEVVVAEVDDIGGSTKEPRVFFNVSFCTIFS